MEDTNERTGSKKLELALKPHLEVPCTIQVVPDPLTAHNFTRGKHYDIIIIPNKVKLPFSGQVLIETLNKSDGFCPPFVFLLDRDEIPVRVADNRNISKYVRYTESGSIPLIELSRAILSCVSGDEEAVRSSSPVVGDTEVSSPIHKPEHTARVAVRLHEAPKVTLEDAATNLSPKDPVKKRPRAVSFLPGQHAPAAQTMERAPSWTAMQWQAAHHHFTASPRLHLSEPPAGYPSHAYAPQLHPPLPAYPNARHQQEAQPYPYPYPMYPPYGVPLPTHYSPTPGGTVQPPRLLRPVCPPHSPRKARQQHHNAHTAPRPELPSTAPQYLDSIEEEQLAAVARMFRGEAAETMEEADAALFDDC